MKPDRTELTVEYVPVGEIQPHPANARQGDVGAIHQSIETNGVYRPLIVQKGTGFILAGNHTYRAMAQQGAVVVPVVWRDVDDETARRIMLADNRTADLGDYDNQALLDLLQGLPDLVGTGYDGDDLDDLLNKGNKYTTAIGVPQYEVVGDMPSVWDLLDDTKTRALVEQVDRSGAPEEVKVFLRAAAHRHTVFNYRLIAEFYPHATPEVQALMEESALVIIDADDAMRYGYLRLGKAIEQLEAQDAA